MMTRDKIQEIKMAFAFFIQNTQIQIDAYLKGGYGISIPELAINFNR